MSLFGLADIVLRPRTAWGHDPSATAVVSGEESMTYGELAERVLRLAAGLSDRGFQPGQAVAILLKNRPEYFELLFAVAHLGGVIVPLNYLLRPKEVEHIVRDSGARWIFAEPDLLAGVDHLAEPPDGPVRVVVGGDSGASSSYEDLLTASPEAAPPARVRSDDVALLQYTSGTTGFPKGAVHTHGTVLFNALAQVVDFSVSRDDVHLVVPSLSWSAGLHCLTLSTLWRGGRVVIKQTGGFEPDEFCALIEKHGVTSGMFAPSVLRMVLAAGALERHDVSSLKLVLSGGEPVTATEIKQVQQAVPGLSLNQGYGVSEFPSTMLYLGADDVAEHGGAAGLSSITANVRVVGDDGRTLSANEHGEIAVRSPASSGAYHSGTAAATSAVVDGWLRTGDRGFVDEDGFVHVAGRVKEMIVSGGLNVYPAEIERVVAGHPDVVEAAVVPVPDDRFGEVGHAHVVVVAGASVTVEDLRAIARDELAGYKIPRFWTIRTMPLPRTVTGKVRRVELN